MKKALITLLSGFGLVTSAFAQLSTAGSGSQAGASISNLLTTAQGIVVQLVPFLISLAVIVFFWFLIKFIWKGKDDPKERNEGLFGMGYSVLALFVMVSIWGLVSFVGSFFGIQQGGNVAAPGLPGIRTN